MAKKKQEEAPKGSPAWMATFSDLMNLLLCFFVLLFSMSSIDAAKFEQVVASFNQTFSVLNGGATAIGDGILISNGVSQLNGWMIISTAQVKWTKDRSLMMIWRTRRRKWKRRR